LARGLADRVREEIRDGRWPVEARLPTDRELARTHGVGMNTVRRALAELAAEGLVDRRHGSGTYVVGAPASPVRSDLIGVLVPTTRRYYPDLIAGVESVLHDHSAQLLLRSAEHRPARELNQIDELMAYEPAGLIITPSLFGVVDPVAYIARLEALRPPVVLAERIPTRYADAPLSFVSTDAARGGVLAVRHLHGLGRRRIGLLSSRNTATSEDVHAGFQAAMKKFGLAAVSGSVVRMPDWEDEDLRRYAECARAAGLDGLVCVADENAARVLPHLREVGIDVPSDISVVTFGDDTAQSAEVPLTALAQPRYEVGRLAAQILLRHIEVGDDAMITQVRVEPKLIVRESCGAGRMTEHSEAATGRRERASRNGVTRNA
jgi:DNA-binding LacI/PurR family transcriptional regulator